MSKLKNAPLLEVIFELRWEMSNNKHWEQYPYLQGDLYSLMRESYPIRELLVPGDMPQELLVNKAVYRFRSDSNYPLFQVGPGLLTLNTIEEKYEWKEYSKQIEDLYMHFFDIYSFKDDEYVRPSLSYYDFLQIDWDKQNVLDYISKNLNIDIVQRFHQISEIPNAFNWGIGYQTPLGNLALRIDAGLNSKQERGLIIQTQLNGSEKKPNLLSLTSWLNDAHDLCSGLFKDLTKGNLYESFHK